MTVVAKLEAASSVALALAGIVVAFVVVRPYLSRAPNISKPVPGERVQVPQGVALAEAGRTLVLALRVGCRFCEESLPFYERLARECASSGGGRMVAVFPDGAESVGRFARSSGLPFASFAGVSLASLHVSGTPTLLLIGGHDTVVNSWEGVLTPEQELDVARGLGCLRTNAPAAEAGTGATTFR